MLLGVPLVWIFYATCADFLFTAAPTWFPAWLSPHQCTCSNRSASPTATASSP